MADKFKEEMKKLLLSLKQELVQNINSKHDSFKSLMSDGVPKDDIDIASDDIDGKMLENLSAQDANKLRLIEAALSRMQTNRYGICMRCGKKIPEGRLRALPYAVLCIDCKNNDERMSR